MIKKKTPILPILLITRRRKPSRSSKYQRINLTYPRLDAKIFIRQVTTKFIVLKIQGIRREKENIRMLLMEIRLRETRLENLKSKIYFPKTLREYYPLHILLSILF